MKAATIRKYGDATVFQTEEVSMPQPKENEVLVHVKYAAVNPIEAMQRKGHLKWLYTKGMPRILGSDFAGVVNKTGTSVSGFKDGDHVFGMLSTLEGGSYAEYVTIREDQLSLAPKNFSPAESAGLPLVCLTTWQALQDLGKMKPGQRILINGASGGVGVYAVQLAKAMGATVTAVTSFRNKDLVEQLGADRVLDYTNCSIVDLNDLYDIFYDVYGNYSIGQIKHLLQKNGSYITTIPSPSNFIDQARTIFSAKKAKVVVVQPNGEQLHKVAKLCEEGKIKPVIDSTFALNEMALAHEKLRTKRAQGKIIIQVAG